jgi:hypothetical protein
MRKKLKKLFLLKWNNILLPWYILSIVFLGNEYTWGQNIVPNPGFEEYYSLPSNQSDINKLKEWYSPFQGLALKPNPTPNFLHILGNGDVKLPDSWFGYVWPHQGKGVVGLVMYLRPLENFREYLSVKLSSPMEKNKRYNINLYVTNGRSNQYGSYYIKNIGILLSCNPIYQNKYYPISQVPTIECDSLVYSLKWHKISFNDFLADSNYQYLTIGNFQTDENTIKSRRNNIGNEFAYYFIDDISVSLTEKSTEKKTMISPAADTTFIVHMDTLLFSIYDWYQANGDIISIIYNDKILLSKYRLTQEPNDFKLPINKDSDNILTMAFQHSTNNPYGTIAYTHSGIEKIIKLRIKEKVIVRFIYEE